MIRSLHFADAHIDMANYGRHDPVSGLPMWVMDFLKSLDTIVDAAIAEMVDLVLFVPRLTFDLRRVIQRIKPDIIHAGPIQNCAFLAALSGFRPILAMSWGYDLGMDAG